VGAGRGGGGVAALRSCGEEGGVAVVKLGGGANLPWDQERRGGSSGLERVGDFRVSLGPQSSPV
jgi:hypothetical protein